MTGIQQLASNISPEPSHITRFLDLVSKPTTASNARNPSPINVFTSRSQGYVAHTKGYNSRVWTTASPKSISPPSAIAYPTNSEEVATLVRAASACGLAVVSRSGGHNYAGFSSGVVSGAITDKREANDGPNGVHNPNVNTPEEGNGVLVIDLAAFNDISFNKEIGDGKEIVTIGAGCRLGRVATELAAQGRALPHGTCPTVSIGGHAAHGGHGLTSRNWGLTLDRIIAHEVVLADGTVANIPVANSADEEEQSQYGSLSWALRGCGPSFAIITSYTLRTFQMPPVTVHFEYWFPAVTAGPAADALMAYQAWIPWVPGELGMAFLYICGEVEDTIEFKLTGMCKCSDASAGVAPSIEDTILTSVIGQFLGPKSTLLSIVTPFMQTLKKIGLGTPTSSDTLECDWLHCLSRMTDGVPLIPHDPRGPTVGHSDDKEGPIWLSDSFYVKSLAIFDRKEDLLTKAQALALTKYLVEADMAHKRAEKKDTSIRKSWWFVMLDNWGGADSAISQVSASSTSSNTRNNLYAFQMFARPDDRKLPFTDDGVQFVKGMWDAVVDAREDKENWNYGGISNYVDPELTREEAQRFYYGDEKVAKLREIKRRWDPNNVFRYPHSILPA